MAIPESVTGALDELLSTLEKAAQRTEQRRPADAIDEEIASPARTTAVSSPRNAPEVLAFRQALVDGLIRVDTANRLLELVNQLVMRLR